MEFLRHLLLEKFPECTLHVHNNEWSLTIPPELLLHVIDILRNHPQGDFSQLVDICGVDYLGRIPRFEVVYHLLSVYLNQRLRIKVPLNADQAVPSIVEVYPCAGWFERETWDMFGIPFAGNTDLRRLLTDYEFEGYPLRKDFPLTGHSEIRYSEQEQRIVHEKVQLMQDFRTFDFLSPWEGHTPVNLSKDKTP